MFKVIFVFICLLFYSFASGQNTLPQEIDLQNARIMIDSLDKQFARHYHEGDSVALFHMYTKDARFETLKGNDILLAWGKLIRNSIINDSRNLEFTTTSLSTDSEYLVELGRFEFKDSKGNTKQKGKYLILWKLEDGNWKLFRDMGF